MASGFGGSAVAGGLTALREGLPPGLPRDPPAHGCHPASPSRLGGQSRGLPGLACTGSATGPSCQSGAVGGSRLAVRVCHGCKSHLLNRLVPKTCAQTPPGRPAGGRALMVLGGFGRKQMREGFCRHQPSTGAWTPRHPTRAAPRALFKSRGRILLDYPG